MLGLSATAQTAPPSTDIYLVDLKEDKVEVPTGGPINLTNRDGYDNQPFFSRDGKHLMYTSQREGQTDIYQVRLADGYIEQVTNTPESEYSPNETPDKGISVIRVEEDGTQRLWRFDRDGSNPALLFTDIKPVGYHAWVDDKRVAMFILGQPPTLQVGALASGKAAVMAESIGRSLHRIPDSKLISFVHKMSDSDWRIKQLAVDSGTVEDIVATLPGREDYAWTKHGTLLMADGASLYYLDNADQGWKMMYDFAPHGVKNITRLAIDPSAEKLAFVATR